MPKSVAYLAPEIPSLSATFVYNEILALHHKGITVLPITVRKPSSPAKDAHIQAFFAHTVILYGQPLHTVIGNILKTLIHHPIRVGRAVIQLLGDIARLGVRSDSLKLFWQFFQACSVVQILRQHGCEHLHIHFAHVPTQIGMYASLLSGIPFTFTSHANDLFERGILLQQKVER